MTLCCLSPGRWSAIIRIGFFGVLSSLVAAEETVLVDDDGIFGLKEETTPRPNGCADEIDACRARYIDEAAGLSGEKMCAAFKRYQECYYGNIQLCTIIEKTLQDKQFIQTRKNLFKVEPKCRVSTTPWDSSLLLGSQLSQSWWGYQGSSPNLILPDSGSHLSGEEPSGPISGTMGLYMNVAQWIALASCCCCCCILLGCLGVCQPRHSKRTYMMDEDDFDDLEMLAGPPMAMYPPTMNAMGYPGQGYPGSYGGGMPTTYFPHAGMGSFGGMGMGGMGNPYGL